MTTPPSLLRSLLRTSSLASPRADRSEEQNSPLSLRASPSFSDFSCGIQADAEGGAPLMEYLHHPVPFHVIDAVLANQFGLMGLGGKHADTETEAATPSAAGSFSPLSRHSMESSGSPSSFTPGFLARRSLDLRADLRTLFSTETAPGTTDKHMSISYCNVSAFLTA